MNSTNNDQPLKEHLRYFQSQITKQGDPADRGKRLDLATMEIQKILKHYLELQCAGFDLSVVTRTDLVSECFDQVVRTCFDSPDSSITEDILANIVEVTSRQKLKRHIESEKQAQIETVNWTNIEESCEFVQNSVTRDHEKSKNNQHWQRFDEAIFAIRGNIHDRIADQLTGETISADQIQTFLNESILRFISHCYVTQDTKNWENILNQISAELAQELSSNDDKSSNGKSSLLQTAYETTLANSKNAKEDGLLRNFGPGGPESILYTNVKQLVTKRLIEWPHDYRVVNRLAGGVMRALFRHFTFTEVPAKWDTLLQNLIDDELADYIKETSGRSTPTNFQQACEYILAAKNRESNSIATNERYCVLTHK